MSIIESVGVRSHADILHAINTSPPRQKFAHFFRTAEIPRQDDDSEREEQEKDCERATARLRSFRPRQNGTTKHSRAR
jgi:hypothetical protein